jgi:hypothetical protein
MIGLSKTYDSTANLIYIVLVMYMIYLWIKIKLKILNFPTWACADSWQALFKLRTGAGPMLSSLILAVPRRSLWPRDELPSAACTTIPRLQQTNAKTDTLVEFESATQAHETGNCFSFSHYFFPSIFYDISCMPVIHDLRVIHHTCLYFCKDNQHKTLSPTIFLWVVAAWDASSSKTQRHYHTMVNIDSDNIIASMTR